MASDCIFCKIAAGEIASTQVLNDSAAVAFMDIGPLAHGHVLLIPKGHFVTLDQMPADQAGAMLQHLPALVKAVQGATGCAGINVLQNNGTAAHQVVQHVHFHIIPRNPGDEFHFNWPAGMYQPGQIEQLAKEIRDSL